MSDCYVCLEECDHVSPCDCAQPVHEKCLHDVRQYNRKCTICRHTFFDDSDSDSDSDSGSDPEVSKYTYVLWCLCSPFIYVLVGCLGQLVVGFIGYPFGYRAILLRADSWQDMLDAICSFNFFISVVIFHVPVILIWVMARYPNQRLS